MLTPVSTVAMDLNEIFRRQVGNMHDFEVLRDFDNDLKLKQSGFYAENR